MPRTRRHKADRGRCISRAARDKRDLGGDRCDTAPDARRQHMVLEDQQALSGLNHGCHAPGFVERPRVRGASYPRVRGAS